MPRYFKEDGTYVGTEYDPSQMVVDQAGVKNHFRFDYRITREAQIEDYIDEELGLLLHRFRKDEHGEDITELGVWDYTGDYPQTEIDGEMYPPGPPEMRAHDDPYIAYEPISIVRDMTEQEKQDYQREKQAQEQSAEIGARQQAQISEMVGDGGAQSLINHDEAGCLLYESLPSNSNVSDPEVFCQMYGNRITRGEITIDDCPSELKERIEEIQADKKLTELTIDITHGKIAESSSINRSYDRGTQATFILVADDGYRVPDQEEILSKASLRVLDLDGNVIPNYAKDFATYYNNENQATINIIFTEQCLSIEASVSCIAVSSKKKKK